MKTRKKMKTRKLREAIMRKLFKRKRGQMLVLVAIAIVVLLGALALCGDVGVFYFNWSQLQKAADASALAGANYLPDNTSLATSTAVTYVQQNGSTSGEIVTNQVGDGALGPNTTLTVKLQRTVPYYFARVLGLVSAPVSATAVAEVGGPVGEVNLGMFPLGLQCTSPCKLSSLDPGQSVTFGQKFVGGLAPGNWQWLDPTGGTGGGDAALASAIQGGDPAPFKIGDPIYSEPGNKGNSGPVKQAFNDRLSHCPNIADPCTAGGGNPSNIPAGDPCEVVVPAVDFHGCTGNCPLTVEGFAEIYIEPNSTSKQINGCFVMQVGSDAIATSGAPELGALGIPILIQ
jgi:hypothetical protein